MNSHDPESTVPNFSIPSHINVLLVDDQMTIGKIVERMLKSETDIRFHHFQSAKEALNTVDTISPTVILQDLLMPEINGLHMVTYFRAKKKTKNTPLIVLSADENPEVKAEAFARGANDYIVKPPNKIELIARIRYHSQAYTNMLQRNEAYRRLEVQSDELRLTNEQLRNQIIERRRIEAALRESKKKAEKEREAAQTANEKIMESIHYAKMIQRSLLPNRKEVKHYLPHSFFIWRPRDVIGGDIFFAEFFSELSEQKQDRECNSFILAVIDCTGHGVPGAFMTMIACSGLRRIVRDEGCHDPANILKRLNFIVKTTLRQDTETAFSDDGLDAAVCFVSPPVFPEPGKLVYAGAKLPLIYIHNDKLHLIRGNKQSVGYKRSELDFEFTNHVIDIEKGMAFYMYTDGFVDQLGGEKERRFGTRNLKNLLKENASLSFEVQRNMLMEAFSNHKGENEIQDDVTVVGFAFGTDD